MLHTKSLYDLLLFINQHYPIYNQAGAFVSLDSVTKSWFLVDLRYPDELASYHDGYAGKAVFSVSASSPYKLTVDFDYDALESWLITRPDCLLPSPKLPSLRHVLTMFKGTQNLVDG